MIDIDITGGPGAVHTLGLRDLHHIQGGLGDHIPEIGDCPTEVENLGPWTGSPD